MRTGEELIIDAPDMYPSNLTLVECFYEPTVVGTLICPAEYLGKMIGLCEVYKCALSTYLQSPRCLAASPASGIASLALAVDTSVSPILY
jgi:translation elongation factor EF-4